MHLGIFESDRSPAINQIHPQIDSDTELLLFSGSQLLGIVSPAGFIEVAFNKPGNEIDQRLFDRRAARRSRSRRLFEQAITPVLVALAPGPHFIRRRDAAL